MARAGLLPFRFHGVSRDLVGVFGAYTLAGKAGGHHTTSKEFGSTPAEIDKRSTVLAHESIYVQGRDPSAPKDDFPTFMLVHGLLGSGRNWRTFATKLAEAAAASCPQGRGRRALLVDLRNHGNSARRPGFHGEQTMDAAAKDLLHLVDSVMPGAPPKVVVGHSLGGKIVLEYTRQAARHDEKRGVLHHSPQSAWVLDSIPGAVADSVGGDVSRVLEALRTVPMPLRSREELYETLEPYGFTSGMVQWLGSNLIEDPDPTRKKSGKGGSRRMVWSFNLEEAAQMYRDYRGQEYWDLLDEPPRGVEINIVKAEKSDRWAPDVVERLEEAKRRAAGEGGAEPPHGAGAVAVHTLEKSGHWVHVDNPKGLHEMMLPTVREMPPHVVF